MKQTMKRILKTASILFFLLCSACTGLPGAAQPTQPPAGTKLFADDFQNVPDGWGISTTSAAAVSYEYGGLRILVNQPNTDAWSVAGKRFADARVEALARKLDGPQNNLIGLICRYQDRGHFYIFFISSDGYYGIARYEDDSYSLIGADQLQYTSVIPRQDERYRLGAVCDGEELSLFVEDWRLMTVKDDAYSEGDVGVFAGVYETAGADILFDDFKVSQP